MKKTVTKLIPLLTVLTLASMVFATRAAADFRIAFTADENGLELSYRLPLIAGFGTIRLADDGISESIDLHLLSPAYPLATLTLSVTDINTADTPNTVTLHYILDGASDAIEDTQGDIELPFCSGGIRLALFKLFGLPVAGDHDLKVFMLLRGKKTIYDYSFDTDFITGAGSGVVTPDDSTVTETVTVSIEGGVAEEVPVQLTFDYSQAFVTKLAYEIQVSDSAPITGDLTLPNARYHIWFDMENP